MNELRSNLSSEKHIEGVMEKLNQIALMADFKLQPHPSGEMLAGCFDLGNGRTQTVYLQHLGQSSEGDDAISIMSPCLKIKKAGLLGGGLSRQKAMDALRRNSQLAFGSFGLFKFDGGDEYLMITSNHFLETMGVQEFRTCLGYVALAADEYEREHGQDNF